MSMRTALSKSYENIEYAFYRAVTREDVANLLEIDVAILNSLVNRRDHDRLYSKFHIPKRSGGFREISAPLLVLKRVQRRLADVLQIVYQSKNVVHGFVADRSIVTNAEVHAGRRLILNVDLKDFFPSVHFGRVKGLFEGWPYRCPSEVAFVFARIASSPGNLPQGAPTSPIISNMICAEMDDSLRRLAGSCGCLYTRYADDLTFSTDQHPFPRELAFLSAEGPLRLGWELNEIIREAGFTVNENKVRLRTNTKRQEVTGLVANVKPNVRREFVRQIRAMLHAWQRYGLQAAQEEFEAQYYEGNRLGIKGFPDYRDVVRGRIEFVGMVKGRDDPIYLRFIKQLSQLDPRVHPKKVAPIIQHKVKVWTEGKTDTKHLRAALRWFQRKGDFSDLDLHFESGERQGGDSKCLKVLEGLSEANTPQSVPLVFMFDRDNPSVLAKVEGEGGSFKKWAPMLFSFAIPLPSNRMTTPEISIEFYYSDKEIKTVSENNRRLYLSSEFNPLTTRHRKEPALICPDPKIRSRSPVIVDAQVYDQDEVNVAMSKDNFATCILEEKDDFGSFDFTEFGRIFEILRDIVSASAGSEVTE